MGGGGEVAGKESVYLGKGMNGPNNSVYMDRQSRPSPGNCPFTPTPTAQRSMYYPQVTQSPNKSAYIQDRQGFFGNVYRSRSQARNPSVQQMQTAIEPQPGDLHPAGISTTPQKKEAAPVAEKPADGGLFGIRKLFSDYCYNKPAARENATSPSSVSDETSDESNENRPDPRAENDFLFIPTKPEVENPHKEASNFVTAKPKGSAEDSWAKFPNSAQSTNKSMVLPDKAPEKPANKTVSVVESVGNQTDMNTTEINSLVMDHQMGKKHEFIIPNNEYFAGRDQAKPVHEPRDPKIFPSVRPAPAPRPNDITSEPKPTSMWSQLYSMWSRSSYGSNK